MKSGFHFGSLFKVLGNINWQKEITEAKKSDHICGLHTKKVHQARNICIYLDILVYGHFYLIFAHLQILLRINL